MIASRTAGAALDARGPGERKVDVERARRPVGLAGDGGGEARDQAGEGVGGSVGREVIRVRIGRGVDCARGADFVYGKNRGRYRSSF